MRKIFISIILMFILTGCSAVYNLEITDDKVIESSDFLLKKSDENEKILDYYYNTNYLAHFNMDKIKGYNYSKKRIDNGDQIGMNLSFTYDGTHYQNSSLLERCFYKKSFVKDDNYIVLYTQDGASCFYKDEEKLLEDLTVNIKTDLTVIENNADSVKGNIYTWKFTNNNFSEKNVVIKIKIKRNPQYSFLPLVVIIIILLICLIIFNKFRKINNKNNKL